MKRFVSLAMGMTLIAGCAGGADESAVVTEEAAMEVSAAAVDSIPAGAADAMARLAASPRHGEWVTVRTGPSDSVRAWVVYPERSTPAPVVVVVHEIFGLSHWVRAVADQLAAAGFIAIAPDLLTMQNIPAGADGAPDANQATAVIGSLDRDAIHRQLLAVAEYGMSLPAAVRRYGIVGFCWGGTVSFEHAIRSPSLGASVVYYGSMTANDQLGSVQAPVLGLYGGNDNRVNATIPATQAEMNRLGKTYETEIFDGAGHGFLRQQDGADGANLRASEGAWPLTVEWFKANLEG